MTNPIPSDFGTFLTWLMSTGTLGFIFMFLKDWAWLKQLIPNGSVRLLLATMITIVLGIGAFLATTYLPGGLVDQFNPYWKIIVMVIGFVISAYASQQLQAWWKYRIDLRQVNLDIRRADLKRLA